LEGSLHAIRLGAEGPNGWTAVDTVRGGRRGPEVEGPNRWDVLRIV
jgi:hypothetical protein